jgi:hypothetical protein
MIGVEEKPTGSNPASPGRDPSKVAGHPFLAKGKASDGRSNGTAFKADLLADLLAGAKATAELTRAEKTASFMVEFYCLSLTIVVAVEKI